MKRASHARVLRRDRRAEHIGAALDRMLDELGWARPVERHTVFRSWSERMGPEIASAARPHRVDGDTLILRVANSAWMNELSLRQNELLIRLNEGRTHSKVTRLIFRLDPDSRG